MTRPFRILGAGPAGLAAAIVLARAGARVEVLERRRTCGARFGGDLQGLENWSAAEDVLDELRAAGLDTAGFHRAPFREGWQTNGRRADRLTFPRPAFYLVKRGAAPDALDQGLLRQALDVGVAVRFGATADPADVDVIATGPRGRVPFAVDRGIVFRTDAPDLAAVLLDDRAASRGYAYLLVTEGYGCLCTMCFTDFPGVHAAFARAKAALLARWPVRIEDARPVGGVGHVAVVPTWTRGRALVVGEAAGAQDFLWGFGMRHALRTGVLAARALLGAPSHASDEARLGAPGGESARAYAAAAGAHVAPLVRAGVVNRFLWEGMRWGGYAPAMAALRWGGPYALLRALHRDGVVQRALAPVAARWMRRRYAALATPG